MNAVDTNRREALTLDPRTLVNYRLGAKGAVLSSEGYSKKLEQPLLLNQIRTMIKSVEDKQEAKDLQREGRMLQLSIENGRAYGTVFYRDRVDEKMPFTKTAFQQLLGYVGGVNMNDMKHNWAVSDRGDKITSALYAHCSIDIEEIFMVRTMLRKGERIIRSIHKAGHNNCYQPFSNLQLVDDLIAGAPEFAEAPIVSFRLNDNGVRLTLASPEINEGHVDHQNISRIETHKPVKTFSLRNSETGQGSLGIDGGIHTWVCSNGMYSYNKDFSKSTPHRGKSDRLTGWFNGAIEDVLTAQHGVLDKYETALDTYIDDIHAFTAEMFKQAATKSRHSIANNKDILNDIKTAGLYDETTPQNSSVAQVAQAVALIAQKQDFVGERLLEEIAMDILYKGTNMAVDGRIIMPVEA